MNRPEPASRVDPTGMHNKVCSLPAPSTTLGVAALLGATLFAGVAPAAAADPQPATTVTPMPFEAPAPVPLDEVRPGDRGWGLSVFTGAQPERFEVEVLGVWRNPQPGMSYILARLSGRGLEETGVIAGMSGSPVYLGERLAGAVSFGWPFAREPVAGITPIEAMRELAPPAGGSAPRGAATVEPADLLPGRQPGDLLHQALEALAAPPLPSAGPLPAGGPGLQWSAAGFGDSSRRLLGEALGGLAAAGDGAVLPPGPLVPGAAVAAVLIDGDLRLAATGTVTDRAGDRVLAFGHPFLGLGPVRLPMASAEIITVLANDFSSFKISNLGPVVGAFDLDRLAGVSGVLGASAPQLPVAVAVAGDRQRRFELRLADVPLLTPALVAVAVLGSLDAATQSVGAQGLDLDVRFDLGRRGELAIHQSFDGGTAAMETAVYLLAFTGYLLQNRLEEVELAGIEVELSQHREPRTARLIEAHAASTLVRPGDRVALNFDLVAYRGQHFRRSLEIEVPTGLPDGRYSLLAGDGVSVDAARLAIERLDPVNFDQALAFLKSLHSRRQLVVLGIRRGSGLAVAGEVLPQLPGSVRSLWAAASSTSAVPLPLAVAQEHVLDVGLPLEGLVRVDLEVRRPGTLPAESEGEPESAPAEAAGEVLTVTSGESAGDGGAAAGGPGDGGSGDDGAGEGGAGDGGGEGGRR